MFSGIIETTTTVEQVAEKPLALKLMLKRPLFYDDIRIGDSIAMDGVCLTLEQFSETSMEFTVAAETLHVTGWNPHGLAGRKVNLERSLKFGDRIHGHMVSGHVDAVGEVNSVERRGDSLFLKVRGPASLQQMVWKKGSFALNGVSLTINEVSAAGLEFCLIPETVRRTNLGELKLGDRVNLEVDPFAKAMLKFLESRSVPGINL